MQKESTFKLDIHFKVRSLEDLPKLKTILEAKKLKPNMSEIARNLDCDRRTAKRYYEGNIPTGKRNKPSSLDSIYDLIQELLTDDQRTFYYKSSLWRYLRREGYTDCAESTFRQYIRERPELNLYFTNNSKVRAPKRVLRFETLPGEQAQIDWKENIRFQLVNGEIININVLVLVLGYSRLKLYALSLSKKQSVLISQLASFFETLGGVPCSVKLKIKKRSEKPLVECS